MDIAQHVMIRLEDQRVILRSPRERLLYARVASCIGSKYGLVAHGLPDNHGHFIVVCSRERAGKFAQCIETALRIRLRIPVRFDPARVKEVSDQHHLHAVVKYVHRQAEHHGVEGDPYHDASSLPDLLGARIIGGGHMRQLLARLAPRLRPADLEPPVLRERAPPGIATIIQAAEAAAAAMGVVCLHGNDPFVRNARVVALAIAAPATMHERALALGCSRRTVLRLLEHPVESAHVAAARIQLRWRSGAHATTEEVEPMRVA